MDNFRDRLGLPSWSGDLWSLILFRASISSSTKICGPSFLSTAVPLPFCCRNRVATILPSKACHVGDSAVGFFVLTFTILYGLPHGSFSTSSYSSFQQRLLVAFISLPRPRRVFICSCFIVSCVARPLARCIAMWPSCVQVRTSIRPVCFTISGQVAVVSTP